jgi:hypothetical protein
MELSVSIFRLLQIAFLSEETYASYSTMPLSKGKMSHLSVVFFLQLLQAAIYFVGFQLNYIRNITHEVHVVQLINLTHNF